MFASIMAARLQLNIPAINPKTSNVLQSLTRPVVGKASPSVGEKVKREPSMGALPPEKKKTKRNFEHREHQDLLPSVQSSSSPSRLCFQSSTHISSQHKRKLMSLVLSPVNDQIFITSALDGVVNLWQVQAKGSGASLLSSTDCVSPKQRRWPEDITWHPDGDTLFAVYSADGGDSQLSILNLNRSQDKSMLVGIILRR